jgi:hypothetical protein
MTNPAIFPSRISALLILILGIRYASAGGIVVERDLGSPGAFKVQPFKVQGRSDVNADKTYFVGPNGKSFTVSAQWIVAIVTFPDLDQLQQITSEASLTPLLSKKKELEDIAARVPQARPYLTKPLAALDADITRFRSGDVKVNGEWFTVAQLAAAEAKRKAEQEKRAAELKAEEERRAAEQKAEEEKRATEERAEEERRVLAEKTAEEKRRAERSHLIAEFKDHVQSVLPHVARTVGGVHDISSFDNVKQLPSPVSDSIDKLVDHARRLREKVDSVLALEQCRNETVTAEALQTINEISRNIAAANALVAGSQVSSFLQAHPEPLVDEQKPLWTYLESIRAFCSRRQQDATIHLQRAKSFFSAGRPSDAVREYQEAYRVFPNPQTATKIKEIQDATLGL